MVFDVFSHAGADHKCGSDRNMFPSFRRSHFKRCIKSIQKYDLKVGNYRRNNDLRLRVNHALKMLGHKTRSACWMIVAKTQ